VPLGVRNDAWVRGRAAMCAAIVSIGVEMRTFLRRSSQSLMKMRPVNACFRSLSGGQTTLASHSAAVSQKELRAKTAKDLQLGG